MGQPILAAAAFQAARSILFVTFFVASLGRVADVAGRKSDTALRFLGRRFDQLLDGFKDILHPAFLLSLAPLQLPQAPSPVLVCGQQMAQAYKNLRIIAILTSMVRGLVNNVG